MLALLFFFWHSSEAPAGATVVELPADGSPVIGADTTITSYEDTLLEIARRILPPGPREGVVVGLPEHCLYYLPKSKKTRGAWLLPTRSASAS